MVDFNGSETYGSRSRVVGGEWWSGKSNKARHRVLKAIDLSYQELITPFSPRRANYLADPLEYCFLPFVG